MNNSKLIRYDANKRSLSIALVYCIFFGLFGMHRFYVGKRQSGMAMLTLTLTAMAASATYVWSVTLAWSMGALLLLLQLMAAGASITLLWSFIDLFLLPGMVSVYNNDLADKIEQHYYQPAKS